MGRWWTSRPIILLGDTLGEVLCTQESTSLFEAEEDEGVSCAQLRLGRILVHKLLRAAFSMESNGFHAGSFADCSPL